MKNSNAGLGVIAVKLGPKLWAIFSKLFDALLPMLKSLVGIKAAGIVGSIGLYSYLFTWQMGVALVVFIGIHEYGHLWAMHRCGIKTKGMFFLPGFGAVAVAEERFGGARNEAYIAIMGPVFGLAFFVAPMIGVYYVTQDPMWMAVASITAFVNLINLLPVTPLDGGRILKAVAYSKNAALSLAIIAAVTLVALGFAYWAGFTLLMYISIIGFYELANEFGIRQQVGLFLQTLVRVGGIAILVFLTKHIFPLTFDFLSLLLYGLMFVIIALVCLDIKVSTSAKGRSRWSYPLVLWQEMVAGVKSILALRAKDINNIEDYDHMSGRGKAFYASCFLILVLVHVVIIELSSKLQGVGLAKELLK